MNRAYFKWLLIGLILTIWFFPMTIGAVPPLRPEVKHLGEIKEFSINIPGIRGASLFSTLTADMILIYGEPGTKLHKHQFSDHFVYILRGSGEVHLENKKQAVTQGDLVLIPRAVPHSILKTGDDEFVFLAISSPPLDLHDFIWLEK